MTGRMENEISFRSGLPAFEQVYLPAAIYWLTPRLSRLVAAAPQVEQKFGPMTLLINNAGQFRAFGLVEIVDPIARGGMKSR